MAKDSPAVRLVGAKVLREGAFTEDPLVFADGSIVYANAPEVDLSGYWVLPAIIDLHGDAFERHLAPRPTAPFDKGRALLSVDRDAAGNGVATAYMAQSWSWEGGVRSEGYAEALLEALCKVRPVLETDLRVQIRFETHMPHSDERLLAAVRRFGVDYVVFNNHLPEAIEMYERDPARVANWAAQTGRTAEEHMEIVRAAAECVDEVGESLTFLAEAFDEEGVAYGSHDDPDEQTRERYHAIGARICEFPTTLEAAAAAKSMGDPVLMGAPNVVRGGSQSGGVSALRLIRRGLCDALVSDYYYPALADAIWTLSDEGAAPFEKAWSLISSRPAEILGMEDRGSLSIGRRADVVVMNPETRRIEATIVEGRLAYMSGEAARRFVSAPAGLSIAAE